MVTTVWPEIDVGVTDVAEMITGGVVPVDDPPLAGVAGGFTAAVVVRG